MDDIGSCPICLDVCEQRTVTSCGHHFCSDCIHECACSLVCLNESAIQPRNLCNVSIKQDTQKLLGVSLFCWIV